MNTHYTDRCGGIQKQLDTLEANHGNHNAHYDNFHSNAHYPEGNEAKMIEFYR